MLYDRMSRENTGLASLGSVCVWGYGEDFWKAQGLSTLAKAIAKVGVGNKSSIY